MKEAEEEAAEPIVVDEMYSQEETTEDTIPKVIVSPELLVEQEPVVEQEPEAVGLTDSLYLEEETTEEKLEATEPGTAPAATYDDEPRRISTGTKIVGGVGIGARRQ